MNPYLDLTDAFNAGTLRAVISSGQAVVLHRLSLSSKDGDWILRETPEALLHVLDVLARRGASYRFGAPLDARWMRGGWSAHFEHASAGLRLRTDFVTRPPRLGSEALALLWERAAATHPPVVDMLSLIALKQTGRERDYAVIGELARRLSSLEDRLRHSRSGQDLLDLAAQDPQLTAQIAQERPLLARALAHDLSALEIELDAERRRLMRADAERLARYMAAAQPWMARWPALRDALRGAPLLEQHARFVDAALGVLPFSVEEAGR